MGDKFGNFIRKAQSGIKKIESSTNLADINAGVTGGIKSAGDAIGQGAKNVINAGQSVFKGFAPPKLSQAQIPSQQPVGFSRGERLPPPPLTQAVSTPVQEVGGAVFKDGQAFDANGQPLEIASEQPVGARTFEDQQAALFEDLSNIIETGATFQAETFDILKPLEKQFLEQALTGETESTRAFRAQEASAMADAISNMNAQVSATAASSGITGQALVQLKDQANKRTAKLMGDFALSNLVNMANTKGQGMASLLDSWGFKQNSINNVIQNVQFANGIIQGQKNQDSATLQNILSIAGENPLAGEFMLEWSDFSTKNPGSTIETFLASSDGAKRFGKIIADSQISNYSLDDVGKQKLYFDALKIETAFVQRIGVIGRDDNGDDIIGPMFTDEGQPVLSVVAKSQLKQFADGVWGIEFTASEPEALEETIDPQEAEARAPQIGDIDPEKGVIIDITVNSEGKTVITWKGGKRKRLIRGKSVPTEEELAEQARIDAQIAAEPPNFNTIPFDRAIIGNF